PRRLLCELLFLLALLPSSSLRAQCDTPLLPIVPGVGGDVFASVLWDPDGGGPATPRLVVAGAFATAGGVSASNIASWDPLTGAWSPLGLGTNGTVVALAVLPTGELVAGGGFTTAG